LLNPVGAVGALCRRAASILMVDAVSALGAEDVDDGARRCRHLFLVGQQVSSLGVGASFLCVAPEMWPRLEGIRRASIISTSLRYRRYQRDALADALHAGGVSAFFALETALDELPNKAGFRRDARSIASATLRIRRVFADLGFLSFTNTGRESHSISTLRLPDFLSVGTTFTIA
jgi:aspartate aminotransferase-like enzyme